MNNKNKYFILWGLDNNNNAIDIRTKKLLNENEKANILAGVK